MVGLQAEGSVLVAINLAKEAEAHVLPFSRVGKPGGLLRSAGSRGGRSLIGPPPLQNFRGWWKRSGFLQRAGERKLFLFGHTQQRT